MTETRRIKPQHVTVQIIRRYQPIYEKKKNVCTLQRVITKQCSRVTSHMVRNCVTSINTANNQRTNLH